MSLSTEESAIRDVISQYAKGMKTANVEVLKTAFHPLAILCGYLGDELIAAPIEALFEWVEANPAPGIYDVSVRNVEITGRVATASISETDDHGSVIDHFHFLKEGSSWSIVSKIWDSEPAT